MYARSIDLPGFDDNVSPSNHIDMLMRFVVGELGWFVYLLVILYINKAMIYIIIINVIKYASKNFNF